MNISLKTLKVYVYAAERFEEVARNPVVQSLAEEGSVENNETPEEDLFWSIDVLEEGSAENFGTLQKRLLGDSEMSRLLALSDRMALL